MTPDTQAKNEELPRLNDKGQCPYCRIKPIPYNRDGKFFCHCCDRDYSMSTGVFQANFAWKADNTPTKLALRAEEAMRRAGRQ